MIGFDKQVAKSEADEVDAFNKATQESYDKLNRPTLVPKAAPKSK